MLIPSTITARRTRRYTSTWYIHPTTHKHDFKPMDGRGRYIFQPPQSQAVNPSRWSTLPPPFTPRNGPSASTLGRRNRLTTQQQSESRNRDPKRYRPERSQGHRQTQGDMQAGVVGVKLMRRDCPVRDSCHLSKISHPAYPVLRWTRLVGQKRLAHHIVVLPPPLLLDRRGGRGRVGYLKCGIIRGKTCNMTTAAKLICIRPSAPLIGRRIPEAAGIPGCPILATIDSASG